MRQDLKRPLYLAIGLSLMAQEERPVCSGLRGKEMKRMDMILFSSWLGRKRKLQGQVRILNGRNLGVIIYKKK